MQTVLYSRLVSDCAIEYWCQQNQAQCPLICLQQPGVTSSTTQENDCDSVSPLYPLYDPGSVRSGKSKCTVQAVCPWLNLPTLLNVPNNRLKYALTILQDQLTYTCVCDNGVSPNITQYSQTLPFFVCQEWGNQCVANCNGDNTCADSCRYVPPQHHSAEK